MVPATPGVRRHAVIYQPPSGDWVPRRGVRITIFFSKITPLLDTQLPLEACHVTACLRTLGVAGIIFQIYPSPCKTYHFLSGSPYKRKWYVLHGEGYI